MHEGRSQAGRGIPNGWRLAGILVVLAFGLCVLNLPVHLVHHLGEANPDCQLLDLSASLNSSIFDSGWLPAIDRTWDELIVPGLLPPVSLRWESAQARAPPAVAQS